MAQPKAVFITPIVPALSGNGLAMRMGMFAEALSRLARLDIVVLPVAGGPTTTNPFLTNLGARLHIVPIAGRRDTHFSLLSQISNKQARLAAFQVYGRPSLASYLSGPVLAQLGRVVRECAPDLIHIGRSYLLPSVAVISDRPPATVDLDEDDFTSFASQAHLVRGVGDLEHASWLRQEGRACDDLIAEFGSRFRRMFVASRKEAMRMASRHPQFGFEVAENSVEVPPRGDRRDDGATLLFLGNLSYAPNAEGIIWFARTVLPRVRAMSGRPCRLLVAGAQPPDAVKALGHPRISILGAVPQVTELYRRATLALAPLRAGGGTRIKLLEAAAHGVASVATRTAWEGLDWPNGGGWLATTSRQFAVACAEGLANPAERNRRAVRAFDWVCRNHARPAMIGQISRTLAIM